MPEKMLTLQEISEYLHIKQEKIEEFVEQGFISAYKVGGELLRFRKEQIDAIRTEIESRVGETDRIVQGERNGRAREKLGKKDPRIADNTLFDRLSDFFYFNDFYIISVFIIALLILVIFKG